MKDSWKESIAFPNQEETESKHIQEIKFEEDEDKLGKELDMKNIKQEEEKVEKNTDVRKYSYSIFIKNRRKKGKRKMTKMERMQKAIDDIPSNPSKEVNFT